MSFFRYWTRGRAHQIGLQAVERGKERVAAWDAAGAEAAYQEAFDALSWAFGEDHLETMPGQPTATSCSSTGMSGSSVA